MKGIEIPVYIKNINELAVNPNLPIPDKLGEGEVLVKVKACGVGFPDYLQVANNTHIYIINSNYYWKIRHRENIKLDLQHPLY
jgi:NADPH:quinone reductase-like Zn-dependent oxidoreductase